MTRHVRQFVFLLFSAVGLAAADPMPFDAIRNPLNDTTDQKVRDSVLMRISRIRVNQAGYRTMDVARGEGFVYGVGAALSFKVVDAATGLDIPGATGALVPVGGNVSGSIETKASNWAGLTTGGDTRYTMTSPVVSGALSQGTLPVTLAAGGPYRLVAGPDTSASFIVDDNVYGMVRDGILKFFGVQRSGVQSSWFHRPSHLKDGLLAGKQGAYSGGWYDCGDHLKEGITMGYAMAMLGTMASTLQDRDQDDFGFNQNQTIRRDGIPDVLRELKVGGDFALNSFEIANKNVANMVTSVGDFGKDHQWWGRPELQDAMPLDRGGAASRILRVELGANVLAPYAGGLAVLSRLYRPYDSAYATRALVAAKALYAEARANPARSTNTPAYNGSGTNHDDLALAAVFLLWATHDSTYLKDLAYDKAIGKQGNSAFWTSFEGGWMAATDPSLLKGLANHDWGSVHAAALYAFHKLILRDSATAPAYGVRSELERKKLEEKVVFTMICNLADVGQGSASIALPASDLGWKGNVIKYDPTWFGMKTQQNWVWNRYQAGNSSELFFYYDVTGDLEGRPLPNHPGNTDWKRDEVRKLLVRQMDYFLGVNPWDMSMILGLGDKNPNHPHHRGANPEGRNTPGTFYQYIVPTGAIYGGWAPDATGAWGLDDWNDYKHTEVCLDGAATMIIPAMGLAKDQVDTAGPVAQVKVEYVSDTSAIITVTLDEWGTVSLNLGLDSLSFPRRLDTDSAGMVHRFEIGGLTRDTQYWFTALTTDPKGNSRLQTHFGNGTRYGFKTKANPPTPAEIANVKVCNVTADSAEILWFTPDGEHGSEIRYGEAIPPDQYQTGDVAGVPVKFHRMKIGGLKEKTTYRFSVGSDGTWDDNGGKYYSFTTPVKSVLFDVRTTTYNWGDLPAMGMLVVNQDIVAYDSLEFRIYMRGDSATMADFGGRVDIGFKYKSDGFIDSAFKQTVDDLLQKQKPIVVPGSCDASGICDWYFTIPTGATQMEPGARFRLDVLFVKRNLPWNNDLLNVAPTKVLGPTDWSWRPHSVSSGDPVDYGGVPKAGKEDVDNFPWTIEPNPYIVVYRKGEFVYGFSPSATLNATKRTDWEMTATLDAPWNAPDGSTVDLAGGKQVRVTGRADVHDRLLPDAKGAVSDIWVNGKRLSDADRAKAAVWDPVARNWILDIPVPLQNGGNQVNVTIFAGAATCSTSCLESGCAFIDRSYFVNFLSVFTKSSISVTDPAGRILTKVVPDSSVAIVQLDDGNANTDKSRIETIEVVARSRGTGTTTRLVLVETGISTGIFRTANLQVVRNTAGAGELTIASEDTVDFLYVDPSDDEDSAKATVWAPSAWPQAVRGGIFRSCGGVFEARILFDRPFVGSLLGDDTVTVRDGRGDSVVVRAAGASTRWDAPTLTLSIPLTGIADLASPTGVATVSVPDGSGAFKRSRVALADSVGPWLDSVKIVENLDGAVLDTVYLWASEALGSTVAATPLVIHRGGALVRPVAMDKFRLDDVATRRWILTLPAGSLREGDTVGLAGVEDLRGNIAGNCPEQSRRMGLITRPVAITASWIRDADQDGRADEVVIVYRRALRAGELPDQVRVVFGLSDSVRIAPVVGAAIGDSILTVPLSPYPMSATRGSGTGGVGALTLSRSGSEAGSGALADSVGPALLSASLRYGSSADTLRLEFSEVVTSALLGDWLQLRIPSWSNLPLKGTPSSTDGLHWTVVVDTFAVVPGDSVRPTASGRFRDQTGRGAASGHPGVMVQGLERPPIVGWMMDLDGDGAAETVELLWSRVPRTRPAFSFLWPSVGGGFDSFSLAKDSWTLGSDSLKTRLKVGPFDQGVTSADRTDLGRMFAGTDAAPFPILDRVPPVLTRATVRYGANPADPDTLLVTWSERVQWTGIEPLLVLRRELVDSNVHASNGWARSDSLGATLLLDPTGITTTRFRRGDSLRLAPASAGTVHDGLGNAAETPARRVPVEFGRRPPRFDVVFQPRKLIYKGWTLDGSAPFQLEVRAMGDDRWIDATTGEAIQTAVEHQIGPVISTNQALRGTALIYDNQGTFVASVNLDLVGEAFLAGKIPSDGSNQYQVRLAWNGVSHSGNLAASGIYTLRLVLRQNLAGDGEPADWTLINQLYRFGWEVPLP